MPKLATAEIKEVVGEHLQALVAFAAPIMRANVWYRQVCSGSGLKSTWMENAHFVEVERHPLYTRVREIFLKRGRELAVTVWDSNQLNGSF